MPAEVFEKCASSYIYKNSRNSLLSNHIVNYRNLKMGKTITKENLFKQKGKALKAADIMFYPPQSQ